MCKIKIMIKIMIKIKIMIYWPQQNCHAPFASLRSRNRLLGPGEKGKLST